MNIYLIGYRCTGKTTLGKALAEHMAWEFTDMDDLLVAEAGESIADMVAQKGWPYFRDQERRLLSRLARKTQWVVGTGGGIILDPANVVDMRTSGWVVWLQCYSETIARLIQTDPRSQRMRPALTDMGLLAEIDATLAEREPLYRGAAHISVSTDDFDIQRLCQEITAQLKALNL